MRRLPLYLSSFLFAAACGLAGAAELGDVRVGSHIGQPLVADIELAMVEDAGETVQARLADPEVYSGAGIAMPPALATVRLAVTRRDGRQFIHVTSTRPVDTDHLHLYLELGDHGQHAVRLATLWLTPDPNPAPPPAQLVPQSAPQLAAQMPPQLLPIKAPAAAVSAVEDAPPRKPAAASAPVPAAVPAPVSASIRAPAAPRHASPLPGAPGAALAQPHGNDAPACARPAGEAQACVALGAKNAELRSQLGRLEEKVRGLQTSLGVAPAAAPPEPPKEEPKAPPHEQQAQEPPGPKPIQSIKPIVPRKPKAPPPDEDLPWGRVAAAAGVLAGAGAGLAVVLRRRRARPGNVDIPPAPGPLARLKTRMKARMKGSLKARLSRRAADAPAAEPSLDAPD